MTNDEKAMYTGMAMSRNTEVTLRWSRSQMFMIINSAMLSVVFTRDAGFWLLLFLGIFGMLMATAWLMINRKKPTMGRILASPAGSNQARGGAYHRQCVHRLGVGCH